jgi:3-hydroxybutyryl-CoA dehydrogenase
VKHGLIRQVEAIAAPSTIFASNTSSFMPSVLAQGSSRPQNLMVAHYFNPAHLIPLVELVPGEKTNAAVVENLRQLYVSIGKHPVVVRKEKTGFIANRLAFALQREAMALVEEGVATPADVDAVVRLSFGRRIPVTGVFQTADIGGLDVYAAVAATIFADLADNKVPNAALLELVKKGRLGVKSGAGWYDYSGDDAEKLKAALDEELLRLAKLNA